MANSHLKCKLKTCNAYHRREDMVSSPKGHWCSQEHQIEWAMAASGKLREQAQRQRKAAKDKPFKEWKAKKLANDLPHQLELTRKVFNTMIRLLDRGKQCPTCGEPLIEGQYDAGHVRTVASCPQLRFDARACFGQCRSCNGSGTIRRKTRKTQEVVSLLYKEWVLESMGQAHYDWLYGPHESPKWSCEDLIAMRAVFSAEVIRLKKGLPPSRNWRQLQQEQ